jgi:hypothetical protein
MFQRRIKGELASNHVNFTLFSCLFKIMPVQRCQRDNEEGFQWGDEGKCYLPSEEGGEEAAREKAAEQGRAIEANKAQADQKEAQEFASFVDVELIRPGVHNGRRYTEDDIDEMIAASNACLPYIRQSIQEGRYTGNEIALSKPIPGLINFAHQKWLKEELKKAFKDVVVEFRKRGEWLTASL